MINPTVGRVVWVIGRAGALSHRQAEAALITFVHTENCINVGGFDAEGKPFAVTSLYLHQDDTEPCSADYAHAEWMPFQKGQAAKYDALAAETAARARAAGPEVSY